MKAHDERDTRFHPTCPRCEKRCHPNAEYCPDCGTWLFWDPPDGPPRPSPIKKREPKPKTRRLGVKAFG